MRSRLAFECSAAALVLAGLFSASDLANSSICGLYRRADANGMPCSSLSSAEAVIHTVNQTMCTLCIARFETFETASPSPKERRERKGKEEEKNQFQLFTSAFAQA